ncbi:MAG TPA: DUF4348 domain-containing protein [Cellvibrio sp.]|nr:DUF4348 domain-containing protein [Cellvibrio sp.]
MTDFPHVLAALHLAIGIQMYLKRIFSSLILVLSSISYSVVAEESLKIEDFSTFIRYFYSNSKFQSLHVQYPLEKTSYEDSANGPTEVKSNLTRENWVTLTSNSFSCTVNCYDVFIYDKFSGVESESNERVLSYKGVDNGIYEALYFRKINGDWFLVKYVVSRI